MRTMRRAWRWLTAVPAAVIALGWQAGVVLAANSLPTVNYTKPDSTVVNGISTKLEGLATDIQYILGATALVALVAAALVNHFVVDQRAKERAKEIAGAAILGLLLAAFAPQIVNWFQSL
ncbi:MAG: hypothetical protein OWV35_06975 [Firmicutes bacterium]|nr:hypothetical protein [Bacillota bacterium]